MTLNEGKPPLSAPVAVRLLSFVSPVFPHFGGQSIHSPMNPQRVNELSAGEMRTSRDTAGPHMAEGEEQSCVSQAWLLEGVIQLLTAPRGEVQPTGSALTRLKEVWAMSAPPCFYLSPAHVRHQRPGPCRPTSCSQHREHRV